MVIFTCAILFMFLQRSVNSENHFKSIPVTVKSYENDTVLLPCYIDETEAKYRVRWYKNQEILGDTLVPHMVMPPRVKMHTNYSLQVDSLQAQDTADYTCEIIRPEPWEPIRQTHSIEVQYAPTVKTIPEDGFLEVRKGELVDIGCETTGTPEPIVDWMKNIVISVLYSAVTHTTLHTQYETYVELLHGASSGVFRRSRSISKGEVMALLEHRSRIRFRAEHRLLAGVYQCIVSNGVGPPIKAAITVIIQDAPVVSPERSYVHTAVGLRAVLSARVDFSVPAAVTHWYRDGRPVANDERIVQIVTDNIHQLIFRKVRKTDFGNYTFRAENKLGMADLSFKLTGVPNVASFKVDEALNKPTATTFTLIWEVDSYSTIIEYNLWLRPYYGRLATPEPDAFTTEPPANRWSKIVVPGDSSEGPIHSAWYKVGGLTPSTVYEAIVTSRNRFGWSTPSAVLHFATEPGAYRSMPSTSQYSDITPILQETEPAYNISQAQASERLNEPSSVARETASAAILFLCFCWTVANYYT